MTSGLGIQHLSSEVVPPSLMVTSPAQSRPGMQSRREGLAGAGRRGGWASKGAITLTVCLRLRGAVLPEFLGA